jgi:hypothetical protein
MPPATEICGRKVGSGAGEKQKATKDLSTNVNTKRARERVKKINPVQKKIKWAKAADTQA